jgi:hypothetical protein
MVNNVMRSQAVAAQHFVTNAATMGVGQPIIVDKANAAAILWPCWIDNIKVIDCLNRAMLEMMMMHEVLHAQGVVMAVSTEGRRGRRGGEGAGDCLNHKLELLPKQNKLVIEVGN